MTAQEDRQETGLDLAVQLVTAGAKPRAGKLWFRKTDMHSCTNGANKCLVVPSSKVKVGS